MSNTVELRYAEGLHQAIQNGEVSKWLLGYFKEHEEEICFGGCHVIAEKKNYRVCFNGNEERIMSFIIQDEHEDLAFLATMKEEIEIDFFDAIGLMQQYINEDNA